MTKIIKFQGLWDDASEYSSLTQADTLRSPVMHFWDMRESAPVLTLTDRVNGAVITSSLTCAYVDGTFINVKGFGSDILYAEALGYDDFMLLSCARATDGGAQGVGHTGFYWDNNVPGTLFTFKTHPYYSTAANWRTLPYGPNWTRTIGQIYTHATVRRNGFLECYILPHGFVDRFKLGTPGSATTNEADYIDAANSTYMGHGGYGTPYNDGIGRDAGIAQWSSVGNFGQDYAGVAVFKFTKGAPSVQSIVTGMRWCENEWTTKAGADKRIYPGWLY